MYTVTFVRWPPCQEDRVLVRIVFNAIGSPVNNSAGGRNHTVSSGAQVRVDLQQGARRQRTQKELRRLVELGSVTVDPALP